MSEWMNGGTEWMDEMDWMNGWNGLNEWTNFTEWMDRGTE